MFRAATIALGLSVLAVPSALAIDFSRATCAHPELKKAMQKDLMVARAPDGNTLRSQGFDIVEISRTTDRFRSRDKLICGFTAQVSGYGTTESLRGQVTFQQFGGGKLTSLWTFGY